MYKTLNNEIAVPQEDLGVQQNPRAIEATYSGQKLKQTSELKHQFVARTIRPLSATSRYIHFGLNGVINRSWGFQTRSFTSQNMNALALTVPKIPEVVKSLHPHFHKISAAITV